MFMFHLSEYLVVDILIHVNGCVQDDNSSRKYLNCCLKLQFVVLVHFGSNLALSQSQKIFNKQKEVSNFPKTIYKLFAKEHFLCDLINNWLWLSKLKFIHIYHIFSAIMDNFGGPERVQNFLSTMYIPTCTISNPNMKNLEIHTWRRTIPKVSMISSADAVRHAYQIVMKKEFQWFMFM